MDSKPSEKTTSVESSGMRVVALLALIPGYCVQFLLDGQLFTHAVIGIVCGLVAVVSGLGSRKGDARHRSVGLILAGFGLVLALWCVVSLPSAYKFQERFNNRGREYREQNEKEQTPLSDVLRWRVNV
jgi:hypothetical protein